MHLLFVDERRESLLAYSSFDPARLHIRQLQLLRVGKSPHTNNVHRKSAKQEEERPNGDFQIGRIRCFEFALGSYSRAHGNRNTFQTSRVRMLFKMLFALISLEILVGVLWGP